MCSTSCLATCSHSQYFSIAPPAEPERRSRSPISRARTPASPRRRPPSPSPVVSRAGSPYRIERSRPIRPPSPGEIRPSRARKERSPVEEDRRRISMRRSPTPDRKRRYSPAGRARPSDYRDRERDIRSPPRRRAYSPDPPPRRRSPRRSPPPKRKRTPSPPSRSRSRTRSPTQTPPPKRHVLPAPKSPTRPPTIPPAPRPATPLQSKADADGDIEMEESSARAEQELARPEPKPDPRHAAWTGAPDPASLASPRYSVASPVATTPTIPNLPPKPEVDPDHKSSRRRRSRSPPTGPRNYAPTPPNATPPPQATQPGPSLPPKPEWTRRSNAPQQGKAKTESPLPPAAPEPVDSGPAIPPYQCKSSVTADIEAEIARMQTHRIHLEADYVQISAAARRALHEFDIASIDLKVSVRRRELADAQLEKAQVGMLGLDWMA
ncbi:hypothetical protein FKP32DRAFT_1626265 [Trametes sanguinea]|nr:hypothetical protein FKP32DRAFT_1626265 [Trametes sanguinea]